jgi:hypothetical protein
MPRFSREFHLTVALLLAAAVAVVAVDRARAQGAGNDATPPEISNITISEVTTDSATITWTTNEDADTLLNFGTDERLGISRDPQLATEHTIVIDNLDSATEYFIRATSSDESGNQNISGLYRFTTEGIVVVEEIEDIPEEEQTVVQKILDLLQQVTEPTSFELIAEILGEQADEVFDAPIIIGRPRVTVETTTAIIEWQTNRTSGSVVALVPAAQFDPGSGDPYTIRQGNSSERVREHRVEVIGLQPATTYHFQVLSESDLGPGAQSGDDVFTTKSVLPEIFGLRVEKIEEEAVTLRWSTNVPSRGVVEYRNTRTNEQRSEGSPLFATQHQLRIDGLTFGTTYAALVRAENEAGEEVESPPITFTTRRDEDPPSISQVTNESTLFPGEETRIQTLVGWVTDELAQCAFHYSQGLGGGEEEHLPEETEPVLDHVSVITELQPATVYRFWITCRDRADNEGRSEDFVLFTPEREKNIIDLILENFESTFGWVRNLTGGGN